MRNGIAAVDLWDKHDLQRFETSIIYGAEDECWEWTGTRNGDAAGNYPVFNFHHDGQAYLVMPAHVLYDRLIDTLPRDKTCMLRSTCENRDCVNPYHRSLSVYKRGKKRGPRKQPKKKEKRKECAEGHDLTRAGARYRGRCRICKIEYQREYVKKIREKRRKERRERKENWAKYAEERLEKLGG